MNYDPQSIDNQGRITAYDEQGRRHVFHTDPQESRQFFLMTQSLSQGQEELGLLLHADKTPEWAQRRFRDGRSDQELRSDWFRKVCGSGLHRGVAERWLTERIKLENSTTD